MKTILLTAFIILFNLIIKAQSLEKQDGSELDFWIGEWNLEWTDASGKTLIGSNSVVKILNNKVVNENFSGGNFEGKSYSVFNSNKNIWQQTWVDNSGGYMEFTGGKIGNKFVLTMSKTSPDGKPINFFMTFRDITKNKFIWDWEKEYDGSRELMWQLKYTRK